MGSIIQKVSNLRQILSNGMSSYFLGSINLYFTCELLKSSSLVTMNKHNYDYCIDILSQDDCWLGLSHDSIYNICDNLNDQENYGTIQKDHGNGERRR